MLDPRIYRAALIPALLALVVVAFSVEQPPRALTTTLPPDSFSGARAFGTLTALADEFPSRAPGGRGDGALAQRVATEMRRAGFRVRDRYFDADTADGRRELRTVVGVRPGLSADQIVVVAHRDALERPATAQLSGTAALVELSRVFRGRRLRKTLVLASTSGGSAGNAGAAELADHLDGPVEAMIVLGDVAGRRERRPMVVPWSNAVGVAPGQLRLTVESALRLESGLRPGGAGGLGQLARLAFPLTIGEQGELLARGRPAVLVSSSGERGPEGETRVAAPRLAAFGRAVLRSITAFDARRGDELAPKAEMYAAGKVIPGWAIRLLSGVLVLPVLIAAIDGLARVRRRRHPVGMWLRWVLAGALPFAGALAFAWLLALTGLAPDAPPTVAPEGAVAIDAAALAVLAAVGLVLVVGWLAVRPLVLRLWGVRGDPGSPGSSAAVALVLVLTVSVIWVFNPFAALVLAPALHACLLVTAPELRIRRGAALGVVGAALLPVALIVLYYAFVFGYGPLDLAWNALLVAIGGHIGLFGDVAWCLLLGCLASVLAIVRSQEMFGEGDEPDVKPRIRGPITYAGPGSLGGTESALRR